MTLILLFHLLSLNLLMFLNSRFLLVCRCVSVFVVAVLVYNPEHPRLFDCPRIDYSASSSSSVEVVHEESVDNSKCDRANYDSDNFLSNMGLRWNKILEH